MRVPSRWMRSAVLAFSMASGALSCAESTKAPAVPDAESRTEAPTADGKQRGWGDELAKLVPKEADFVLAVAGVDEFAERLPKDHLDGVIQGATQALSERLEIPVDVLKEFVPHLDGLLVFGTREFSPETGGIIIRFKTLQPVRGALGKSALTDLGGGRWAIPDTDAVLSLVERERVLVITFSDTTEAATMDTIASKRQSFGASQTFRSTPMHTPLWFAANLQRAFDEPSLFGEGSRFSVALDFTNEREGSIELGFAQLGAKVPRLGSVLAPTDQHALRKLPEGALVAMGVSLRREAGRTVENLLDELDRPGLREVKRTVESALTSSAKVSLADLERTLGDSAAIAVYATPGAADFTRGFFDDAVVLVDIDTKDDSVASKLVDTLGTTFATSPEFKSWSGGFACEVDSVFLTVQTSPGHVFLTVGNPRLTHDVLTRGPLSLGATDRFMRTVKTLGVDGHLAVFADEEGLKAWLPREDTSSPKEKSTEAEGDPNATGSSFLQLSLAPVETGISANARGAAGAISGLLSLYLSGLEGSRRYAAASFAREARSTLSQVAHRLARAYETPQPNGKHVLCAAPPPVPAVVPRGVTHQPSTAPGEDFGHAAWKCIGHANTKPMRYQIEVRVGSGYKGPGRGGPDPGKNGFEVSAEGDLDGDGVTSLQTLTAVIDPKTHEVTVAPKFYIVDTLE